MPASAEDAPVQADLPVYHVRFSGPGLYVFADPSLTGEPTAVLADQTQVQVIEGPTDYLVRIRVCGTELEGYTDVRYLKRTDAVVADYDIYTYEEMEADIRELQARYPDLLRVDRHVRRRPQSVRADYGRTECVPAYSRTCGHSCPGIHESTACDGTGGTVSGLL